MSITLIAAGATFSLDAKHAKGSSYLAELVETGETSIEIPSDVPTNAIPFVIEWLGVHSEVPLPRIERPLTRPFADTLKSEFDQHFLTKVLPNESNPALLLAVVKAANVLGIKDLGQFGAAAIASIIRGKKAEEIRTLFNLKDDFTADEKKALAAEAKYAEPANK